MDQIKLLVKDVLHKIQDIPELPFTPIRMSEIKSEPSFSPSTSRSVSENSISSNMDALNGTPKNDKIKNLSDLRAIEHNLEKLYVNDEGSRESLFSSTSESHPKYRKNRPTILMGKRALSNGKSGEEQETPAVIVHELVNEKYQDKISHYIGRMYHRRLSRESRANSEDDGSSSMHSGTFSTISTPDCLYNGKSYFSLLFPTTSESGFDFTGSNGHSTMESFLETTPNTSSGSEFDPKKFLNNALGDTSFDCRSLDTSLKKSKISLSQNLASSSPSKPFLSKAGSFCSTMRKSIRRVCSFKEKNVEEVPLRNSRQRKERPQSFSPDRLNLSDNLMQELYVQNGIIFQVSKALNYCRSNKDISSQGYIEAEKILLVSSCKKEAIQASLDRVEFDHEETCYRRYSGTIEISSMVFFLKADNTQEVDSQENVDEHFLVIVSSGITVLSSEVIKANHNGEVKIDRVFCLPDLSTDFQVSVAIYSMNVKRNISNKHRGSDLKLHKKEGKVPCPTPKRIFHIHHKSSHKNLVVENVSTIKPSSFRMLGTCTIRCSDLERTHFRMHHVPLGSLLEGYFTAALVSKVRLTNRSSGFLTIGIEDKGHLVWNRRWCVLEGSSLKHWNYPSEEFSSEPIGTIELKNARELVSPADRSICPGPKSLCLLIGHDEVALKYFLSADSVEEKEKWQEEMNFVIATLRVWNFLSTKRNG